MLPDCPGTGRLSSRLFPASGSTANTAASPARLLVLLSRVPLALLHVLARAAAFLVLLVPNSRRRIIRENLLKAFPELSNEERRRLERAAVQNLTDVAMETIKAFSISEEALNERVHITNAELLERFAGRNQSIILLGSHEANWEWVALACSSRSPIHLHVVYRRLPQAGVNAFLRAMRSRFGALLFTRQEFQRALIEGRKRLRAIALVVDERPSTRDERHWVCFFNRDTAFRSGFATLAGQWQYPVVFASRRRTSRGHYEVTFVIVGEPPYDSQPVHLVERYVQLLQQSIAANPADWLWTQPRWNRNKPFYD
ncbi:MAG: lysophospholipid acyltransferase family protein [Gammaproteobacteria bacterium]